jgi:hypothetical protein
MKILKTNPKKSDNPGNPEKKKFGKISKLREDLRRKSEN